MHSPGVDEQSRYLSSNSHEHIDLCAPLNVTISHIYVTRERWVTKGLLKSSHNLTELRINIF